MPCIGPFDDPNWDLFIWSILQNNKKLALVFWEQTRVRFLLQSYSIYSYIPIKAVKVSTVINRA